MRTFILLLSIFSSHIAFAQNETIEDSNLNQNWVVSISNLEGEIVTKMKVRFSDRKAKSCLGGQWKELELISYETSDENFFPVEAALSYERKDDQLIIGSNEICDAYMHLDGKTDQISGHGDFIRFGWGTKTLGHFFLFKESVRNS